MLSERPVSVVRHGEEERVDPGEIRLSVPDHIPICVCMYDLADEEGVRRKRDGLCKTAFKRNRAFPDHGGGLEAAITDVKDFRLVGLPSGDNPAVIGPDKKSH